MTFNNHLFNIHAGVGEALKSIKELKIFAVKLQQYEYSAKLRDIEKSLENAENHLSGCTYPTFNKGLTPKGKLFYSQLFSYGAANSWKNIPVNFRNLLLERKAHLNSVIEFDDASSQRLIDVNRKLAGQELQIKEFYDFIDYVITIKGIKDHIANIAPGNISMKCYTHSNFYKSNTTGFIEETLFYQFEFPLTDLARSLPVYYSNEQATPDFLQTLPLKFRDEKICLLFSLLATDAQLAWEDFLNIDRIELDLPVNYQFSSTI